MRVVVEDRFGLRERSAWKKRNAHPVVNQAAGNGKFVVVVESAKRLEVELAAAELRVDGLAARLGIAIEVEKVASEEIGVHAGLSLIAIAIEGGESFGFGFVGEGDCGQKAKHDGE
jgi:hypothetical protein